MSELAPKPVGHASRCAHLLVETPHQCYSLELTDAANGSRWQGFGRQSKAPQLDIGNRNDANQGIVALDDLQRSYYFDDHVVAPRRERHVETYRRALIENQ